MVSKKLPALNHPTYRPDIDGLRAVAIISVVLFHAFPDLIPGGFIGVDIFFVISGYLISTIIFSSLEHDRFNLYEFYLARIRRIFPALILVLIASLVFGWHVLFSDEYSQLGKHAAAGAGFIQNIALWREDSYFANIAETKPLLHLWSLAVEEQFYIFWPLLLTFVWKRQWSFLKITTLIAAISFAVNIYLIQRYPTAAFYLPVSRFWELMIGGMLAYAALHRPELIHSHKNAQSLLGFTLLLAGLLMLTKGSEFPGWWALLPALGGFFIISAGSHAWLNQKILSNKLMVSTGLISYPLYLWHWPLLSYLKIIDADASMLARLGAVATSVVLAWMTYQFVERPIRFGTKSSFKPALLFVSLFSIGIFGISCWSQLGFQSRTINAKLDFASHQDIYKSSRGSDGSCNKLNGEKDVSEEVCLSNSVSPQVLFAGDSHAMALYSAIFTKEFPLKAILISGNGCPIYPNLHYTPSFTANFGNNCTEIAQRAQRIAEKYPSIHTVVMVNNYHYSTAGPQFRLNGVNINPSKAFIAGNAYFIERMLSLGKKVLFVEDIPYLRYEPKQCVKRLSFVNPKICDKSEVGNTNDRQVYNSNFLTLKRTYPAMNIFNTGDIFCETNSCKSHINNQWLYTDTHHISIFASAILLKKMRDSGYLRTD